MKVTVTFKDGHQIELKGVTSARTVASDTVLELVKGDSESIHYAPVSNLEWWIVE